jgi:hypothetical protein
LQPDECHQVYPLWGFISWVCFLLLCICLSSVSPNNRLTSELTFCSC